MISKKQQYQIFSALENLFKAFEKPRETAFDDKWITIGAGRNDWNEATGRHVKIDGQGNIVGGSLPKSAQGKNIRSWWKKTPQQNTNASTSRPTSSGSEKPKKTSVLGNEKPLTINTYYRSSRYGSHGYWGDNVLEATPTSKDGEINIDYPDNKDWKDKTGKTSRTNYVDITIGAGFKNGKPYNLNFDNIKKISGKTYGLSGLLKEKGFHWNGEAWVKGDTHPNIQKGNAKWPDLKGSEKQIAWAERIRAEQIPEREEKIKKYQNRLSKINTRTDWTDTEKEERKKHYNDLIQKNKKVINEARASWWIDNRDY